MGAGVRPEGYGEMGEEVEEREKAANRRRLEMRERS